MPNLTPIPSGTSPEQTAAMINRNFQQLNAEQVTKLYNDASGTPSILIGVDSNGESVIKVAKPSFDVTTASDENLLFHSAHGVRYLTSFSAPFSVTSGAGFGAATVTITHNLGYIPITDNTAAITTNGWAISETGIFPLPYQSMATSGTIRGYAAYVIVKRVTTTTITYEIGITGGTLTLAGSVTCYVKQSI